MSKQYFSAKNAKVTQKLVDDGMDYNVQNQDGDWPLHKYKSMAQAKVLVKAGHPIDAVNSLGETALFRVVKEDNLNLAKFLEKSGADVLLVNQDGKRPVDVAVGKCLEWLQKKCDKYTYFDWIKLDQIDKVKASISKNPINKTDDQGNICLHFARSPEMVKLFVRYAVDITKHNNEGITPIMSMLQDGAKDAVLELLKHEPDLKKCICNHSVLEFVSDVEMAKLLVSKGANIYNSHFSKACQIKNLELAMYYYGQLGGNHYLRDIIGSIYRNDWVDMARQILGRVRYLYTPRNYDGYPRSLEMYQLVEPLYRNNYYGSINIPNVYLALGAVDVVHYLLEQGKKITNHDYHKLPDESITYLCKNLGLADHNKLAQEVVSRNMVEHIANIKHVSGLLQYAKTVEMCQKLIRNGQTFDQTCISEWVQNNRYDIFVHYDKHEYLDSDMIKHVRSIRMLNYFLKHVKPSVSVIKHHIETGNVQIVKELIKRGLINRSHKKVFNVANKLEMVNLLQEVAGIDEDLEELLWTAVDGSKFTEVKKLLEKGADPNCKKDNITPLHATTNKRIVNILLDYGADPLIKYNNQHALFSYLKSGGNSEEIVERMLQKGINVNKLNNGYPLSYYTGSQKVLQVLVNHGIGYHGQYALRGHLGDMIFERDIRPPTRKETIWRLLMLRKWCLKLNRQEFEVFSRHCNKTGKEVLQLVYQYSRLPTHLYREIITYATDCTRGRYRYY